MNERKEYARCFPSAKFMVSWISEQGEYEFDDGPHKFKRQYKQFNSAAEAGAFIASLSEGHETAEVFKLEDYDVAKALAAHNKKEKRRLKKGKRDG